MPQATMPALPAVSGWLYDLLRWAGVAQPTAAHLQQVVVKPVSVVVIAVGAAVASWLGNRVIRHWIGSAARKATARRGSQRASARASTVTAMVANLWRVVVWAIALFVALETIGINLTPLLAGATVIGATIGFGAQSLVRDLLSGFLLIVEDQFDIGDTLVVGDITGTVEDLTLRVTRLRAADGTVWVVSNGEIRQLGNRSRGASHPSARTATPRTR
ncbi:MAG: mechanosensitive ion channel domain-containing protein [Acidimicrobiales bacterium]